MWRGANVARATAQPSIAAMAIVSWVPAYSDSCAPARLVSRTAKRTRDGLGDPGAVTLAVGVGLVRTPPGGVEQALRRTTASANTNRLTARSTCALSVPSLEGGHGGGLLAARRPGGAGMALGDPKLVPAPRLDPVGEDHIRDLVDFGDPDLGHAAIGRQALGRLSPDQVGALAVHLEAGVELL